MALEYNLPNGPQPEEAKCSVVVGVDPGISTGCMWSELRICVGSSRFKWRRVVPPNPCTDGYSRRIYSCEPLTAAGGSTRTTYCIIPASFSLFVGMHSYMRGIAGDRVSVTPPLSETFVSSYLLSE